MDNPQHYQPLSHALHPPLAQPSQYSTFSATAAPSYSAGDSQREEEEEEEEEVVEEELDDGDRRDVSPSASPQNKRVAGPGVGAANPTAEGRAAQSTSAGQPTAPGLESPEQKRRPGRPKGSRNRKPRESAGSSGKSQFPSYPMSQSGAPPLPGVTAQNQQYYEFQWRVLNLCSEFYGAAEELIKATPSLVIAQSYQMGPSSKVDPLGMLNDAKRICDQLLQNPSQLVGQPPPPVYSSVAYPPPPQSAAPTPAATTPQPSTVITNPSTFVMPLGMPGASQPMYPTMYATTPSRYPTAPYYQYPPAPGYYPMPPQSASAPPTASSSAPPTTQFVAPTTNATTSTLTMSASNPAGASGAWADDEVERLKRLAEQSRTSGSSNETDWDWVVGQWGNTRTRHQILLKATALGLKESTTRGVKRRRDGEIPGGAEATPAPAPPMGSLTNATTAGAMASPAQSHTTASTPSTQPSPAIHNPVPPSQPQPQSSTSTPTPSRPTTAAPASNLPWPMPTVAANTSPVITAAPTPAQADQRNAGYYRQQPRGHAPPPAPAAKVVPPTSHQYMFQPNGKSAK